MRALPLCLWGVALGWTAVPAQADIRSYCEAYARNQADERLSGRAIFEGAGEFSAAEWKERNTLALADCVALYTPKVKVEPVTAEEDAPVTTLPAKSIAVVPAKQKIVEPPPKPKQKTANRIQHHKAATQTKALVAKKPKPATPVEDPWKTFDHPGLKETH